MQNSNDFYVVGIGASAGGHDALKDFFSHMPPDTGMAFVVVTHLLRTHKSILPRILSRFTAMPVLRMKGVDMLKPNTVFVLPENASADVKNGMLLLKPRKDDEIINKTIDEFFHALAEDQQEKAIAIVFSGMGTDGADGVQTIHAHGGIVLVQEPGSTAFKSMPDAAIRSDHPDEILPPAQLAENLLKIISEKRQQVYKES